MALHKFFGKFFTAFQTGTFGSRPDNGDMLCFRAVLEIVVNTFYQRIFGTDYDHVDFLFKSKCFQCIEICSFDVYVLTDRRGSGITGSDV